MVNNLNISLQKKIICDNINVLLEGIMTTVEKVKEIIANQLSVKVDTLKDETNIAEELGADSLDVVEILMSLEDEFGVSIPDEAIPQIKTIKDIVEFIDTHK